MKRAMMAPMLPQHGSTSRATKSRAAAFAGAGLVWLILGAAPAPVLAQTTTTAMQDQSCLGTRAGQTLGCSAGDLTATAVLTAASGTAAFCQAGQSFIFNANVAINKSAGNTRYDV